MAYKVDYEFKTDSLDRKYALKVNLETGKKERINYKLASKRSRDLKYRRERVETEKKLEVTKATWQEYQKTKSSIKKDIKSGKRKKISKTVDAETLERLTAIRSRYRFSWRVWELPDCNTPYFIADGQAEDGDVFEDYIEEMDGFLRDIYDGDLCPKRMLGFKNPQGGACVVLYRKFDKKILKMYELGDGCSNGS